MTDTVKIGVIGCGEIAEQWHLPLLKRLPGFDLRWTCDRDLARARGCAGLFGISDSFDSVMDCPEVDAVVVATPVGSRLQLLDAITARRWDAFCEKPFAPSLSQHEAILAMAGSAGLVLGCGYMRRFYWATGTAKNLVATLFDGKSLDVVMCDSQRLCRSGHRGDWYLGDPGASGGGFLMETGSHLIDQALAVAGASEVKVQAARQVVRNGIDYETAAEVRGLGGNGGEMAFQLLVSRLREMWSGIAVSSGSNCLEVPLIPGAPLILTNRANATRCQIDAPLRGALDLAGAYSEQLTRFRRRVLDRDHASNDRETGLLTTTILSGCYQQAGSQPVSARA